MSGLAAGLLGPIEIELDGKPITWFETKKECALLVYLAAEVGQPLRRDALAEMLWPDRPEGAARANLRHAIYNLRTLLGDRSRDNTPDEAPPYLRVERNAIQLHEQAVIWLDTRIFLQLLLENNSIEETPVSCLEEAVRLYRGPFLEGFHIGDSAAFEEWLLIRREQYKRLALNSLDRLAQYSEMQGNFRQALDYTRRQVDMAPWDEEAHTRTMRLLAYSGRNAEALAHYEDCRQRLVDELGVEPGDGMKQVVQQIRNNTLGTPSAAITSFRPRKDLESPGFFTTWRRTEQAADLCLTGAGTGKAEQIAARNAAGAEPAGICYGWTRAW